MKCNNTHCKYYRQVEHIVLFGIKGIKKVAANTHTARKRRDVEMKRYKKPKNKIKYELTPKEIKQIKYDTTKEATQKAVLLVLAATQEVKALTEDDICEIFETVSRWINFMDNNLIKLKDVQEVIEKKTGVKLKG